jgi:uncharacterized protein
VPEGLGYRSCLYEGTLMHERFHPKAHRFEYPIFTFCFDLDEIDRIAAEIPVFARDRWNLYSFVDRDHMKAATTAKQRALDFLAEHGVSSAAVDSIRLVTFCRVLGYVFNPVSFYYALDVNGDPIAGIAEVGNTFGEQKPFFLQPSEGDPQKLVYRGVKHFYVSPFSELDDDFSFRLPLPGDQLVAKVDTISEGKVTLHASLTGNRVELTNAVLLRFAIRYPLVTLATIGRIHWHALLLWRKRIPLIRKSANPDLQTGIVTDPISK